jgi:hypothetical protein
MNAVRVDLMASAAGKIGGVTWHHLYLVAADASGRQACLRAGPQCLPIAHLAGRKNEHGDALEDYEASPAGPYGAIILSSGAYEPGAADFDPAAANVTLATANAAEQLWNSAQHASKALGEEQIPYDPVGKGANWAIMEVLRRCGVAAALPPKRWAPGAGALDAHAAAQGVATRRVGQAVVVA